MCPYGARGCNTLIILHRECLVLGNSQHSNMDQATANTHRWNVKNMRETAGRGVGGPKMDESRNVLGPTRTTKITKGSMTPQDHHTRLFHELAGYVKGESLMTPTGAFKALKHLKDLYDELAETARQLEEAMRLRSEAKLIYPECEYWTPIYTEMEANERVWAELEYLNCGEERPDPGLHPV